MKNFLLALLFIVLGACQEPEPKPMIVIDKNNTLRTRWLAGEMYFSKVYKIAYDGQIKSIEEMDIMFDWEVGDTVGWDGKFNKECMKFNLLKEEK